MSRRILVFGADGQIGWELCRCLHIAGVAVPLSRQDADFSRPEDLSRIVALHSPGLIVNAAAYTQVDRAEKEKALARKVNCEAVEALALKARELAIPIVHFSTDYVFSGNESRPYRETDRPEPLNVYGRTKLDGEEVIRASGAKHLILRTAWIYSARRSNFLLTMLRAAQDRDELRVVNDQTGSPTWAALPAQSLAAVLARYPLKDGAWPTDLDGIYHVTATGSTTWYGFASEIMTLLNRFIPDKKWPSVVPIPSADYPTDAVRPAWSVLDTAKFSETFGAIFPCWRALLQTSIRENIGTPSPLLRVNR